jgi:hypothetical protein
MRHSLGLRTIERLGLGVLIGEGPGAELSDGLDNQLWTHAREVQTRFLNNLVKVASINQLNVLRRMKQPRGVGFGRRPYT